MSRLHSYVFTLKGTFRYHMVYFKCYLGKQLEKIVPHTDEHRQQLQETFETDKQICPWQWQLQQLYKDTCYNKTVTV